MSPTSHTAIFAAGCFWGVEETFCALPGVMTTEVGYTGGHMDYPTYEQVCTGKTGHAEAIELTFDPNEISYAELLNVFWDCHNPTTHNRQGPDIGSQYRSAIFYHTDEQLEEALKSREQQNATGKLNGEIITEIIQATQFYPAEEYHQKYFMKRGGGGSCHI